MRVAKKYQMKDVTFIKIERSTKDLLKTFKNPSMRTYNQIIKKMLEIKP